VFVSAAKEDRKKWAGWTDRFVKDFPGSTAAHYMRGDALARVGKLDKACKSYGDALKIHENFSLARTRWGIAELLRGRKNEGLRAQNNAVSDGQCKLAACYAALGTYYAESPCAEAALECFQAALKLDPNFALAYNGRGCAYYGMGKPHEAYRDFEIAQRLCPAVAPAAAANQGFVRAMVEKKVAEKLAKSHTGTTLRTKSQVIGVDTLGSKVRQGRAGQKPRDFTQMGVKQTLECAGRAGYDRALSQIRQQQRALLSEIDRIHHDIDVGTRRTVGLCNATILGAEAVKFGVDAVQLGRTLAAKKVCEFTMKSAFSLEKDLASLAASDLHKPEGSIVKTGRAGHRGRVRPRRRAVDGCSGRRRRLATGLTVKGGPVTVEAKGPRIPSRAAEPYGETAGGRENRLRAPTRQAASARYENPTDLGSGGHNDGVAVGGQMPRLAESIANKYHQLAGKNPRPALTIAHQTSMLRAAALASMLVRKGVPAFVAPAVVGVMPTGLAKVSVSSLPSHSSQTTKKQP